jgi:nitrous oxidase accessory protein
LFIDNAPQSKDGRVEVRKNLIAQNDVGIALEPLTRRVELTENDLIGNTSQVDITGTGIADADDWSPGGRGNYWSDAVIYDRDGDGVSDLPFRLEATYEVLADRRPILALFSGTPASDAIDAAGRLFPIFSPRPKLTDAHPLARPVGGAWTEPRLVGQRDPRMAMVGFGLVTLGGLGLARFKREPS